MNKVDVPFSWKMVLNPLVLTTFFAIVVLDQITKWWIILNLPLGQRIPLLSFFEITHIKNRGAAFGIFHDSSPLFRAVFFGIVTIVCVFLLVQWMGKTLPREKYLRFFLALTLGGAVGNLIDRVLFGEVTDFVHVFYQGATRLYSFPAFNVADSAISVGITLILVQVFFFSKQKS